MYHVLQVSLSTQFGGGLRGAKPPGKAGRFGRPRGTPNQRDGRRGEGTVNGFWGMVPSRGMVKVGVMVVLPRSLCGSWDGFATILGDDQIGPLKSPVMLLFHTTL